MDKPKGVTEQINDFIAKEGGGIVRDALNVALARLEMMTHDRDWWKAEWEKEVRGASRPDVEKLVDKDKK